MLCTPTLPFIWDFTGQGTSQLFPPSSSQGLSEADLLVIHLQARKGSKIRGLIYSDGKWIKLRNLTDEMWQKHCLAFKKLKYKKLKFCNLKCTESVRLWVKAIAGSEPTFSALQPSCKSLFPHFMCFSCGIPKGPTQSIHECCSACPYCLAAKSDRSMGGQHRTKTASPQEVWCHSPYLLNWLSQSPWVVPGHCEGL